MNRRSGGKIEPLRTQSYTEPVERVLCVSDIVIRIPKWGTRGIGLCLEDSSLTRSGFDFYFTDEQSKQKLVHVSLMAAGYFDRIREATFFTWQVDFKLD